MAVTYSPKRKKKSRKPVSKPLLVMDSIKNPNHHQTYKQHKVIGELTPETFAKAVRTAFARAARYNNHYVIFKYKRVRGKLVPVTRLYKVFFEKVGQEYRQREHKNYKDFATFYHPHGIKLAKKGGLRPSDWERNVPKIYYSTPPLGKDRFS